MALQTIGAIPNADTNAARATTGVVNAGGLAAQGAVAVGASAASSSGGGDSPPTLPPTSVSVQGSVADAWFFFGPRQRRHECE